MARCRPIRRPPSRGDERTRELRELLSDERDTREDAIERLDGAIEEAVATAARELVSWRNEVERATIAGLRLQFLGFPLVLLGLVLQVAAGLVTSAV